MSPTTPATRARAQRWRLAALWVPLWLVFFAAAVLDFGALFGISPVHAAGADGPESLPVVLEERNWPAQVEIALRPGDRLLAFADESLRGKSALAVFLAYARHSRDETPVPVRFERGGQTLEAVLPANTARFFRPFIVVSLIYAAVSLLLLFRAPPTAMVRDFVHAFFATAMFYAAWPDSLLGIAVGGAALGLSCTLNLIALRRFPDDRPAHGAWANLWPWLFLVVAPLHTSRFGAPFSHAWAQPAVTALVFLFFAVLLVIVTRNYRTTDAVGRRQLRWVLLAIYLGSFPPMLTAVLAGADPRWTTLYVTSLAAVSVVPIGLLISVVRYNLFDIDRVISAAASYNVLLVLAVAGGLVAVPQLADLFAAELGVSANLSRLALGAGLALLVLPAQRWLRPRLERIFFQERWQLDRGIAEMIEQLGASEDASELTMRVGEGLSRLFRPEVCVVYALTAQGFAPVFVDGRAVPPGFDETRALVTHLRQRRAPLALEAGLGRERPIFDAVDQAALETLGASVVVPIYREGLVAFLVLGSKRSGDVYTPTDLALLAAVADRVATELRRYDQEALVRESRALQERLRSYVPGAVADQLSAGGDLAVGRREVTVLFVDMRGYTEFSEGRAPEAIFSTVNRYTQTVSQLIQKHGGSVVEFNGDGMMAVFGAPAPLPSKERAALRAAREIVIDLDDFDADAKGTRISAGVGIASGEAFVGPIRAADRMIWSAIGNTTNLAARLQGLTRDWNAAIVIDARTRDAAPGEARDFESREHTPIRGRRELERLYALPLERGAPA